MIDLGDMTPNERNALVHDVFDRVAQRYDIANDVLSLGLHRLWKRAAVTILNPPTGDQHWSLLDCATGSGDLVAECLRRAGPNTRAIASDINPAMLDLAISRMSNCNTSYIGNKHHSFVVANAETLPFRDRSVDAVTIGFGIRNVGRFSEALKQFHRVLKPGGKLVCLEFSSMQIPELKRVWDVYSHQIIPLLGKLIAGSADPYSYLTNSIEQFPNVHEFPCYLEEAGFSGVDSVPLSGGVAVIYSGWRSAA